MVAVPYHRAAILMPSPHDITIEFGEIAKFIFDTTWDRKVEKQIEFIF